MTEITKRPRCVINECAHECFVFPPCAVLYTGVDINPRRLNRFDGGSDVVRSKTAGKNDGARRQVDYPFADRPIMDLPRGSAGTGVRVVGIGNKCVHTTVKDVDVFTDVIRAALANDQALDHG